jgi:hypothetical protein
LIRGHPYVNPKKASASLYHATTSKKRGGRTQTNFAFRVRIGEYELEISGSRKEVLDTIGELPSLIVKVHKAFETVKPKTVATLTVKTEDTEEKGAQKYPRIGPAQDCDEAVIRVLETDWGKWRPRTLDELKEALRANGLNYPGRVLAGVLMGLVRKGKIRRWNTDAGFVYILVEKEALETKGEHL